MCATVVPVVSLLTCSSGAPTNAVGILYRNSGNTVPRLTSATQYEPSSNPAPISSDRTSGASGEQPLAFRGYDVGERIAGKYTLIARLGEGGMGTVWRAHNEFLDIDVAVKVLRASDNDGLDGTLLSDRLLQEARAAARLGHPSIARVFDYGTTERNNPYIVMELLKGEDLAEALSRRGRVSNTKAVSTLMPIAHALAAAHAQGIVHRDLKPENVFLSRLEDGRVLPKLVDFGIAKIDQGRSHRLTQTGTMLGSPIYMSPEQARGDDVDHRADIWAFCVVLYELLAGRTPFEGRNYNALLYAIISDEPRPLRAKAEGDEELWEILRRGFEKEPDRRWSSMEELGRALAQWLLVRGVSEDISGASLKAQWFRSAPTGDVLTSMLPQAMQDIDMPAIPRRSDRAKWATETRSLGRRPTNSLPDPEVARWYARLGGALRETSLMLSQRLRKTRSAQWASAWLTSPALTKYRWQLAVGAGASVLLGALVVGVTATSDEPDMLPTPSAVVDFDLDVQAVVEPQLFEKVALLLAPEPEPATTEVSDVSTETAVAESKPSGRRYRRNVAARPAATPRKAPVQSTRLKNPFD